MAYRQTVQTQIRHRIMRRLNKIFTVKFHRIFYLTLEKNDTPEMETIVGKSIWLKWVAGKGPTSWLSFVVSKCKFVTHWYPGSGVLLDCIDS